MAFDPSVLSQIGSTVDIPGAIGRGMQLKDLANTQQLNQLRVNEVKQQQSDEAKAREIFKTAKYDTQNGVYETMERLNKEGLRKQALEFGSMAQKYQSGEIEKENQILERDAAEHDVIAGSLDSVMGRLNELKERGATPAELDAAAASFAMPEMNRLAAQYKDNPRILERIRGFAGDPKNLSYQGIDAAERQSNKGQQLLKERLSERKQGEIERENSARDDRGERALWLQQKKANANNVDEEKLKPTVKAIAEYRIRPPTLSRSPQSIKLMEMVAQENPEYDATRFDERNKAVTAFGTGPQGNTVRSLNVGVQHLDTLAKLAVALDNNDTKVINKLRNIWRDETGQELPGDFEAAKQVVGDEIVKAVQGAGSAGALGDREEIKKQLDAAKSPKGLAGVIRTYKSLMGGQLRGLRKQYQDSTGLGNFNDKLETSTIEELDSAQESPAGPASAPTSTAKPYADADKEKRYQEWKKSHGQ